MPKFAWEKDEDSEAADEDQQLKELEELRARARSENEYYLKLRGDGVR